MRDVASLALPWRCGRRVNVLVRCLIVAALCAMCGPLAAADELTPDRIERGAQQAQDLMFPSEASSVSAVSRPQMAIFKPEGIGPFPAIVLMHQCGGLGNAHWQNAAMLQWAKDAVARGYVAFLVDYMHPRGVDTLCQGPRNGLNFFRGAKDAFQAAQHLKQFDFVDPQRIGLAGFSWGAMIGVFASSKTFVDALGKGPGFRAVVAFYPGCFRLTPKGLPAYEIVQRDIRTPLLALMGEADTETPAAECVEKLGAAKAAGAPVEWHVYPGTTHCWDCKNLDGFFKIDPRGSEVRYRYDAAVTEDAGKRMFGFFGEKMGVGSKP
jgi:dienelactone hydrolase